MAVWEFHGEKQGHSRVLVVSETLFLCVCGGGGSRGGGIFTQIVQCNVLSV